MINRPALARSMRAFVHADDSVILTAPTGDFLVIGAIYEELIPLLDGERAVSGIADKMDKYASRAEVYYGLNMLEAQGCLAEGPGETIVTGSSREGNLCILSIEDPMWVTEPPEDQWTFLSLTPAGYWIGPRFGVSVDGPCWHCVEFRMAANRPLAALAKATGLKSITPARPASNPAAELVAMARAHMGTDVILELSEDFSESKRHVALRRPECPYCGDPSLYSRVAGVPVVLQDNSIRANTEQFIRTNAHLLDPVTGICRSPRKLFEGLDSVHVYIGGANRACAGSGLAEVTQHLRSFASGKGATDTIARASLIGELAERYSATWRGDEPRVAGSFDDVRDRAVHPNTVMLFSDAQSKGRDKQTAEDPIPVLLPYGERIDWTPVWSLTEQRQKLLPTALLYFGAGSTACNSYCIADSNGNAAGVTRESAMLQGTLELIERDAVGIWWFNMVRRPALSLAQLEDAWVDAFVAEIARVGRDLWVLDITTDIGIPAYAAVSRRNDGGAEQIVFGFGAHVDAHIAVLRALTELGQTLVVASEIVRGSAMSRALSRWWEGARISEHSFLSPAGFTDLRPPVADAASPAAAFAFCRQRLEKSGLECLVLDQTRADVGVPVVKMIVPGLRHYRQRLAPGRLYEVPVALGWQPAPIAEEHLNPELLAF